MQLESVCIEIKNWKVMDVFSIFFCISLISFCCKSTVAVDTITHLQSLRDGETLISRNGSFELGFFSPGNSQNRYLGMWYKNILVKTVVWVANRKKPIEDSTGILLINSTGNNIILLSGNKNNNVVWSTTPQRKAQNLVLQLLDSGNLVLREENDTTSQNYFWQSFDYPSDTILPGMKIGKDLRTGFDRHVTAWKNQIDPSPGNLTLKMDINSYPELTMWFGARKYYQAGSWNGILYSGQPSVKPHPIFRFSYYSGEDEVYFKYHLVNQSQIARIVLDESNKDDKVGLHYVWIEAKKSWKIYGILPRDFCDVYAACGPNGKCDIGKSPACECLKGFQPKLPSKWRMKDYAEGCVRTERLNCLSEGFIKYVKLKLPDTTYTWLNQSMDLEDCRVKCLSNCSCMAYANSDIRGAGNGCAMWFSDLMDIRVQPDAGQDVYIRVPASELESTNGATKFSRKAKIGLIVGSVSACGILLAVFYKCRSRMIWKGKSYTKEEEKDNLELPQFNLSTIVSATDNFSIRNKLGQGGFGSVYKGLLNDGLEIAVKRLSRSSSQGLNEFKNEVKLIAKLQHRNLVKLLGCCIEGEEILLIYEYMPNKGLDFFIFDQERGMHLDWSKRFNIICGIARGLLYLHQDSRLRIIHRDLKASNVLLDDKLNPKISDFGLARTFVGDQGVGNTNRVVGTYGYMAPEYAIDGHFSVKSDVFSFGVLVLEVVTGKRNTGFYDSNVSLNLIGYAWKMWNVGQAMEVVDECLRVRGSSTSSDMIRMVHIGLLCLQKHPQERPTMSSVVFMLDGKMALPDPKEPAFFLEHHTSYRNQTLSSANKLSITELEAR